MKVSHLDKQIQEDIRYHASVFLNNTGDILAHQCQEAPSEFMRQFYGSLLPYKDSPEVVRLRNLLDKRKTTNDIQALVDLFIQVKDYLQEMSQRPEQSRWTFKAFSQAIPGNFKWFCHNQMNDARKCQLDIEKVMGGKSYHVPQDDRVGFEYGKQSVYHSHLSGASGLLGITTGGHQDEKPVEDTTQTPIQQLSTDGLSQCHAVLIKDVNSPRYWLYHVSPGRCEYGQFDPKNLPSDCPMALKPSDQVDVVVIQRRNHFNESQFKQEVKSEIHALKVIQLDEKDVGRFSLVYNINNDQLDIQLMDGRYTLLGVRTEKDLFTSLSSNVNNNNNNPNFL